MPLSPSRGMAQEKRIAEKIRVKADNRDDGSILTWEGGQVIREEDWGTDIKEIRYRKETP